MPNLFAFVVIYSYPLVVLALFLRLDRPRALIWSIMLGYLFLPEGTGIDLPLLPPLDKTLIPSLSAAVMCWLVPEHGPLPRRAAAGALGNRRSVYGRSAARSLPQRGDRVALVCIAVLFAAPIATVLTNRDPVIAGPRYIGGLAVYDIFSLMLNTGVMLLPFLLARRHLTTPAARLALLRAFVVAGLVYSALILIEVRLSPQLNKWIYGFYSHSFEQHIRAGGFRPMIFIEHGLRVGIFMAMTVLAAFTLCQAARAADSTTRIRWRSPGALWQPGSYLLTAFWLLFALFISKTVGALAITLLLIPILLFCSSQIQALLVAGIVGIVLLYPTLRAADLVPVEDVVATAQSVSAERADSLQYRLDNENILLDRAAAKPMFGWGSWGRNHVFDPESGRDLSVTDGTWVIAFGSSGWVGYLALFGLLVLPALTLSWRRGSDGIAITGLTLMLTANLIDLIPNSGLTPLTWMLGGTLLARSAVTGVTASDAVVNDVRPLRVDRGHGPAVARRR
ncbi:hypothetical protein ACOI1H_17440 [Loktanella sp. DJP18]|uniref:hypothetical protein n=1 Tax=Loktanella sp. DJP18 TaxID=3409788 RepID=UPI003BB526CC